MSVKAGGTIVTSVKIRIRVPVATRRRATSETNWEDPMAEAAKKPNALQKPLTPSSELAAVVGAGQITRGEVVSKVWEYIKKNNLQNPANKREIVADDKLKAVFSGKDRVSMFEMNKHLAAHLK
jgi:chromatin remodeling complex protein RSC6